MIWALAVLHELNPTVWTALLDTIAAAPEESLDEVACLFLHKALYYARCCCSLAHQVETAKQRESCMTNSGTKDCPAPAVLACIQSKANSFAGLQPP